MTDQVSTKRLRSVIQSTAHHAVSGLCFLHPHLGQLCRSNGRKSITIDLMRPATEPEFPVLSEGLDLSVAELRNRFYRLLTAEKIDAESLAETTVHFTFMKGRWPAGCTVTVRTAAGKRLSAEVAMSGRTVKQN